VLRQLDRAIAVIQFAQRGTARALAALVATVSEGIAMRASELWAAWIVAAVLVGLVAWVGHVAAGGDGLTPASDVARRAPASIMRPTDDLDDPPILRRIVPSPRQPSSSRPREVYLCVIDGPLQGAC
jgi:hypothetical protein